MNNDRDSPTSSCTSVTQPILEYVKALSIDPLKKCNLYITHRAPGVHKNLFEMHVQSRIELEFGSVGFLGEGKTGVPREKPLRAE